MAILTANQLSKVYGHKQKYRALNNISFSVEKGEFVAVMGPSGSGKTTLLNVLSSIDTISGGTVEVEGKENIMLPLSVQKFHKYEMEQNYKEVAEALGIYNLGNKYPSEISGGQQQRTAAARAFVHKPTIIFADEPTGALDSKSAQDLLHRLEDMNKQFNSTIMMVTHDPSAASYAERVIMLKDGDIHSEIYQGNDSKQTFYQEIMKLQTALGGVSHDI